MSVKGNTTKGNKPLKKKEIISNTPTLRCYRCNKEYDVEDYYTSDSELHISVGRIPYCKDCLDELYQYYLKKYEDLKYPSPDRKAIERLCMTLDLYYNDKIFDSAVKELETRLGVTLIAAYFKQVKLYQYRKKNYDTTINEKYQLMKESKNSDAVMSIYTEQDRNITEEIKNATLLFGSGFDDEDYVFLYEQYSDWVARHECKTKAQEEVFKQICFTQLELLKATRRGEDTKDLNTTFLKQLEAAKLQPKQSSGDTTAETQTFGTLIDKWENTRPIPEIDEDLKDVDKIGKYINVFFKGHLSKMMGIKNSFCKAYDDFMKKYSVEKPEYETEDYDSEALFDAIFGGDLDDK